MSDLRTIRAAIKAKLDAIASVGVAHEFVRYNLSDSEFQELYVVDDVLNGWSIHRTSSSERAGATDFNTRIHRFEIRGYLGVSDGHKSELEIDDIIEDICHAFRMDETIGDTVNTINIGDDRGIQVVNSDWVQFVGVLCHAVRLNLSVEVCEPTTVLAEHDFASANIALDLIGNEQSPDLDGIHIVEVSS